MLASLCAPADAAVLPVQGALRTVAGGPVSDGTYILFVKIYDVEDAQVPVWSDSLTKVGVSSGFFAVVLGTSAGAPLADTLLASGKPLWIGIAVNSDPELPRVKLSAVASAYFAHVAAIANAALAMQCTGCITNAMIEDGTIGSQKVSFTYAGSDAKGGTATWALGADIAKMADAAKMADGAKTADTAALADVAKLADKATAADASALADLATKATEAASLQCSGCVSLSMLGSDVQDGFLSTQGGTVTGATVLSGGVDLKGSTLAGANLAVVDVKTAACTAKELGRVALDTTSKKLHFCDGSGWQRLLVCGEVCQSPDLVDCGKALTNACGEAIGCSGTGTKCAAGTSCSNGACVSYGGTADNAGLSCKDILSKNPLAKTGTFWLDPDGASATITPYQARCEMDTDGGGWTMISIISSADGIAAMDCNLNWDYGDARWTDGSVLNDTAFDGAKDRKFKSYSTVGFGDFMMVETVAGKGGYKVWSVGAQTSFATMMQGPCKTLASSSKSSGGTISPDNAIVYSNNLLMNCNSDYGNNDDKSRLHGNSPNNPQGNCINGGWGLGVDGDVGACSWESEARPQTGGWTTQCYPFTGFYTGGEMCGAGCAQHHDSGTFVGALYVR